MSEDANTRPVLEATAAVAADGPLVLLERYDEWFSADFEWRPILLASLDGRVYRGRAAFEQYWAQFLEAFTDVEFSFGEPEAVDHERVMVAGEVRGKGAVSGAPIDRVAAYVFEVADGKITAGRSFFSPADAKEYLDLA